MATASVSTLTVDAAGYYGKSIHTYQPAKFLIPEDSYIDIQMHMVKNHPRKNNYSSFSHQKYYKFCVRLHAFITDQETSAVILHYRSRNAVPSFLALSTDYH